jgi:phage regulator Rha-like protein
MAKQSNFQVPVPVESVICTVRGQKVILDDDIAKVYAVEVRHLNEQVKRNADRFPDDFMFRITSDEWEEVRRLRSQNATLKRGRHRKYPPYAFTEHGALMAANILKSMTAVSMSIYVVRVFVRMRKELTSRGDLEKRLDQIEKILLVHDAQLKELFDKLRPLLLPPPDLPRKPIGFEVKEGRVRYGKGGKRKAKLPPPEQRLMDLLGSRLRLTLAVGDPLGKHMNRVKRPGTGLYDSSGKGESQN